MKGTLIILLILLLTTACQQGGPVDLQDLSDRARRGDADACRRMVALLAMEANDVNDKVYPLLIDIGEPMAAYLLDAVAAEDREQRERTIAALGTLRIEEAIKPISQVLSDKSLKRRYIAAWALGEIGGEDGIPALIAALGDTDLTVRQYATRSLIKFNRTAVDPLIRSLGTAEPVAAAGAIRALGDIGDKKALAALLQQADGPNRNDVFMALGKLRDPAAEKVLVAGLSDNDWQTRMTAAMALGNVGGASADAALVLTLDDPVVVVREWSARSLSVIRGKTVRYRDADGAFIEPYSVYH